MNVVEAITSVLGKYAVFKGRASRSEFWWWWLVDVIIFNIFFTLSPNLGVVYFLATVIPTLAVTVRRHHDGNRSGWNVLIGFIPLIGGIILVVLYSIEGTEGPNDYGEDPLKHLRDNNDVE